MDSQCYKLKKVFIFGTHPSTSKLVKELALLNPDVIFDYATTFEIDNIDLLNVNLLQLDILANWNNINSDPDINSVAKVSCPQLLHYLNTEYLNYDFIIFGANTREASANWIADLSCKVPVLHPSRQSVLLENDKSFLKTILIDAGIPTPSHRLLNINNINKEICDAISHTPVVIKINLPVMWGYGTWVFKYQTDKKNIINLTSIISRLGNASNLRIYSEEYIDGREVSAHFLCNGTDWKYLGAARDYKKINDGDTGGLTLSTGCYSPVTYFSEQIKNRVFDYMDTFMKYLNSLGIFYKGIMYLGIIIDNNNIPYILELNARAGSPELISILDTTDNSNLLENLYRAATGNKLLDITHNSKASVCVGLLHKEYLGAPRATNSVLPYVPKDHRAEVEIHRACPVVDNQNYYGFITATGEHKKLASDEIYKVLTGITLNDYRCRTDIGYLE